MLKLLTATLLTSLLAGCTGLITGHEYSSKDMVVVYKVVKKGVTTFMTAEQIAQAKLDKLDIIVTDTYKVIEGNDVPSQ